MRHSDKKVIQLIRELSEMKGIHSKDIPNIDLYMDQVTTFMEENLADTKRDPSEKVLTKTMINNYTKNDVLPPPKKKKYTKEHILLLTFLYYFKNVLSLSDIQRIFKPMSDMFFDNKSDNITIEEIYETILELEQTNIDSSIKNILERYNNTTSIFSNISDEKELDYLSRFSLICHLSFDAYLKQLLVERLIDETFDITDSSSETKKKKKDKEKD